jgi:hypothetical protein
MTGWGRIVTGMSAVDTPADEIGDLFSLDVQTGPLHELPSMSSEDCTSDTCTNTCVCGPPA